jgi:hypothetical protein
MFKTYERCVDFMNGTADGTVKTALEMCLSTISKHNDAVILPHACYCIRSIFEGKFVTGGPVTRKNTLPMQQLELELRREPNKLLQTATVNLDKITSMKALVNDSTITFPQLESAGLPEVTLKMHELLGMKHSAFDAYATKYALHTAAMHQWREDHKDANPPFDIDSFSTMARRKRIYTITNVQQLVAEVGAELPHGSGAMKRAYDVHFGVLEQQQGAGAGGEEGNEQAGAVAAAGGEVGNGQAGAAAAAGADEGQQPAGAVAPAAGAVEEADGQQPAGAVEEADGQQQPAGAVEEADRQQPAAAGGERGNGPAGPAAAAAGAVEEGNGPAGPAATAAGAVEEADGQQQPAAAGGERGDGPAGAAAPAAAPISQQLVQQLEDERRRNQQLQLQVEELRRQLSQQVMQQAQATIEAPRQVRLTTEVTKLRQSNEELKARTKELKARAERAEQDAKRYKLLYEQKKDNGESKRSKNKRN